MDTRENCTRLTRASKKRAFASSDQSPQQISKKRVVLGDLTNLPNIRSTPDSGFGDTTHRPDLQLKKKKQKKSVEEVEKHEVVLSPDDSRKCGYAPLIYLHLHSLEVEEHRRPLPDYIEKVQKDIKVSMREILVDWLVEVAEEYNLVSDTLYLTVSYIDRFLSSNPLSRNKLQLLGVSCMLVASKYEEISPPHVEDFCYITDNSYSKEEVVNMEKDVLKFLNFEMGNPTAKTFFRIFTKAAQENSSLQNLQFEFLGWYLAELSLLDYNCVRFLPSVVAASAIFLARFTIQPLEHPWSLGLQQYTGYKASEVKNCVLAIHALHSSKKGISLGAVREKYLNPKFKCVPALICPSQIPAFYFEDITVRLSSRF